ncbi:MAG: DUF3794 domain-containing protein [Clostridiales bacterium]|nr:DUF3794 domain-containing protein [Clostridiales bacterium]
MSAEVLRDMIRLTNIRELPPLQAFFEEDILVPDIKPDVARIGGCKVEPRLTEKENYGGSLKLGGDLYLDVIYTPAASGDKPAEVANARIPFRHEGQIEEITGELEIVPRVEHLEVTMINERKLRMKTVISFSVREYQDIERNVFRGFRNDKVEMLEKNIVFTDIADHKKDYIEVKDEARLKDGMPEIDCVLKSDFRVAETYRQITADKAIISGVLFYDIMYLSEESEPEPMTLSGKTEFTHFIKPDQSSEIIGSEVFMKVDDVRVVPKRDESDNMTIFDIIAGVSVRLDTFTDRTLQIVEDAYHGKDILDLEKEEINLMRFGGSGSADISAREKIEFGHSENIEKIVFAFGEAVPAGGEIGNGKFSVEGVILADVLYTPEEGIGLKSMTVELPFRGVADVPGLKPGMNVNVDFVVKNVSGEKINDRQAEVTADIMVAVKGFENITLEYIKNAGTYDNVQDRDDNTTRLIMYMTKNNDRLWDVGKRYRIPLAEIKDFNGMDESLPPEFVVSGGEKLLIWT